MKTTNLEIYVREVQPSKKYPYIRYQAYFYVIVNGKRKRIRSDYFTTQSKAKAQIRNKRNDYLKTGIVATTQITIDDIFKLWIENASLKTNTIKHYKNMYNIYFIGNYKGKKIKNYEPINNTSVSELTTVDLQRFVKQVSSIIEVKGTFNSFRSVLVGILRTAYKKNLVTINYCDKLDFSMKDKISSVRRTQPLNFDNCKLYISHLSATKGNSILKNYAIDTHILLLELLRVTGTRISELLSLTWENFDIENKRFYVSETKNGLDREILLSKEIVLVLTNWKQKQENILTIAELINENNTILTSRRGTNLSYQSVISRMRKFWKETGIHIHPHQFRHAKATLLLNVMNESIANVSSALGHINKSSTYHYLHDDNRMLREMNEKYERLTPNLLN